MKMGKKWQLWNDAFGHLEVQNPFLTAGPTDHSFGPAFLPTSCSFWLLTDPFTGVRRYIIYPLRQRGEERWGCMSEWQFGVTFFLPFSPQVCHVEQPYLSLHPYTRTVWSWQIARAGEPSLSEEMSRRSGDRIWVRAASSSHLYCCASGISWH